MNARRGFTLVEVVVAAAILQIGLLAVLGTLVLASRILADAAARERAAAEASWIVDSLVVEVATDAGEVERNGVRLRWRRQGTAWVVSAETRRGGGLFDLSVPGR